MHPIKQIDKIILIFGNGYVASFLAQELNKLGWIIYCTSRKVDSENLNKGANINLINFLDPNLPEIIKLSKVILSTVPPYNDILDPVLQKYFNSIVKQEFKWVGYLSATSVYGDHSGNWVNEQTKCCPSNEKSKIRLLAEQQWLELYSNHQLPVHIFRLSGIYGPNRNCLEKIEDGKNFTILKDNHFFSRIHVLDICKAIIASINTPTAGEIYNVSDDEPAPIHVIEQFGAFLLNKDNLKEIRVEDAGLSNRQLNFFNNNKKISNQKIKTKLNIKWDYPNYKIGLQELLNLKTKEDQ